MRVGIIGAGPSGTVCALTLLAATEQPGQRHEVVIFDGKSFLQAGPGGCNMCAGVIPGYLLDKLAEIGANVPPQLIQCFIKGHYFETLAGGVHIPKDPTARICTVFRSVGPIGNIPYIDQSFDHFLLDSALAAGAKYINSHVQKIRMPKSPNGAFHIRTVDGNAHETDILIGASGVNSALTRRFEELGFGYRPPKTIRVCQAELPLHSDFIEQSYRGEIKIFSLALPDIRFGALTPKRHHITVTLIGKDLKQADLERFLSHPKVRQHFPRGWTMPSSYCYCYPRLPVTAARNPISDRMIIVGDANISRYLKGGIESAFFTGSLAAKMVLEKRLSRDELVRGYIRPCHQQYLYDNAYGRLLFGFNDIISKLSPVALAGLWLVRREQQLPLWRNRRQTRILWHIFTGDAPYRQILQDAFSLRALSYMVFALTLSLVRLIRKETIGTNDEI